MKYNAVIYGYNKNFEKYIIKKHANNGVAIIEFDDSEIEDVLIICLDRNQMSKKTFWTSVFGEDECIYRLTQDGCIKQDEKGGSRALKKEWRRCNKFWKKFEADFKFRKSHLEACDETKIITNGKFNRSFSKCYFADKEMGYGVPFRFKKSKGKNAPLLVFFQGGGCIGHDNRLPLSGFKPMYRKMKEFDCNILIPQIPHGGYESEIKGRIEYVMCTVHLIENLIKSESIDAGRIYVMGTSLGGGCVWEAISAYPKMFAAALPVIGTLLEAEQRGGQIFENMKNIPIWIAHSSDDNVVSIETDDYCFNKLKELGADVKYTRWDKYGHRMGSEFYKKEPWAKWLFEQSRQTYL